MYIGIDVGGTNLKAGLVDENGRILAEERTPLGACPGPERFAEILAELGKAVMAKGGGNGRLFGSITNAEIAEALEKKTGIKLDKRKPVLNETIKNVGTYTVTCKLGYEITAPLTVKIEEA